MYVLEDGGILGHKLGTVTSADGSTFNLLEQPWFRQVISLD